jgi:hypothetical protein
VRTVSLVPAVKTFLNVGILSPIESITAVVYKLSYGKIWIFYIKKEKKSGNALKKKSLGV